MNECARRLVLWFLALVITILFLQKGHSVSHTREDRVAFLPGRSARQGGVTIRIAGDRVKPGVYHFSSNVSLGTVINMTMPFFSNFSRNTGAFKNEIHTGDVVTLSVGKVQHVEITIDSMSVTEKMILGIPLDPNALTANEWEKFPRIGPSLAKKIITDRQQNGDFLATSDLERVPGIGPVTIKKLDEYLE